MNHFTKLGLLTLIITLAVSLQACKREETSSETPVSAPPEVVQNDHPHAPGTPPHSHEAQLSGADWVELDNYKFRLSPEIGTGGDTHLDLYIHNAKDQHVSGAKVMVSLTAADGHKMTVVLTEEKAGKHYGGKTTLEDMGEYQAVAQVTVNGKQLNPRFNFSRSE